MIWSNILIHTRYLSVLHLTTLTTICCGREQEVGSMGEGQSSVILTRVHLQRPSGPSGLQPLTLYSRLLTQDDQMKPFNRQDDEFQPCVRWPLTSAAYWHAWTHTHIECKCSDTVWQWDVHGLETKCCFVTSSSVHTGQKTLATLCQTFHRTENHWSTDLKHFLLFWPFCPEGYKDWLSFRMEHDKTNLRLFTNILFIYYSRLHGWFLMSGK